MQRLSWKGQTTCLGVCATRVRWCTAQLTGDSRNEEGVWLQVRVPNCHQCRRYASFMCLHSLRCRTSNNEDVEVKHSV